MDTLDDTDLSVDMGVIGRHGLAGGHGLVGGQSIVGGQVTQCDSRFKRPEY